MGGAVSSGRDNNELVNNLISGNYIRSREVEQVFRVLDRADYMSPEARDQAYKDLAWRNGPLHLSAPCIYSEVMEALELKPGMSFLNVGSGTGYLSTLAGLIIGSSGVSHGVEAVPFVIDYANKKLGQFIENSISLDEFDFCMPKYYTGNGLCMSPTHSYDRVYCGAGVLAKYEHYFKLFTKVGGVLVMPLSDTLVQLKRVSRTQWTRRNLLHVSFALLRDPAKDELEDQVKLDEASPASLQVLSRGAIRAAMRGGLMRRQPELRAPPLAPAPPRARGPRRICIPYEPGDDDEEPFTTEDLNELHDLDEEGGAHEMNALLSLVLSMTQNRQAGSLQLLADHYDDDSGSSSGGRRSASRSPQPGPSAPPAAPDGRTAADTDSPPKADVSPKSKRVEKKKSKTSTRLSGRVVARRSAPAPVAVLEPEAAADAPRLPSRTLPSWVDSSSGDDEAAQVKERKRQKLDSGLGEGTASSASPDKSDDKTTPSCSSKSDEDDPNAQDTDMPWCDDEEEDDNESASSGSSSDSGEGSGGGGRSAEPSRGRSAASLVASLRCELKRKKLDSGLGCDTRDPRDRNIPEVRRRLQKRGWGGGTRKAEPARRARTRALVLSGSDSGAEESCPMRHAHRAPPAPRDMRRVRLSLAMKRAVKELPLPHALKQYVNYGRCYQF